MKAALAAALVSLAVLSVSTVSAGTPDLVYVLQPETISVAELAGTGADWLVLEPAKDGSWADSMFTPAEVGQIQNGCACHTKVLAYLSIGEAENYRDYWDPAWVDTQGNPVPGVAPAWLGPTNPDWLGNYKIRYWDPDWQNIIIGTGDGTSPLERIAAAGFDGVYLDIVDGYQYWSEAQPELTRMDARSKMIDFIEAIAGHARQTNPGFLVFPQNASDITRDDNDALDSETSRFFAAVNGIGIEDLYYDEVTPQPPADTAYRVAQLDEFIARGKTVLVTDYVIRQGDPGPSANDARASDFIQHCRDAGYIPYAAHRNRDLNEIVTFSSAGWTFPQPEPGCAACSPADLTDPAGVLDLADINAFVAAFTTQQPAADLAEPFGVFDLADLGAFAAAFLAGCG